jgi:hypothetical protein
MAEDVAKARLLLDDRAGQRQRHPCAQRLADELLGVAPAVGDDRARQRIAAGGRGLHVGEVVAQALRVLGAFALGALELRRRALLRGPDDKPERADAALRLQAEHAADAPESEVGLRAPFAVDLDAIARPQAHQMRVQARLQVRHVRLKPPRFIKLPHGGIRALAQDRDGDLRDMWRFCAPGPQRSGART